MDSHRSSAFGSVLGAFIGEALGAFVIHSEIVTPVVLEKAMTMPGGGPFGLGEGQVTDNSELAMCLMQGLLQGEGQLDMDAVAHYNGLWGQSEPASYGITVGRAIKPLTDGRAMADVCIAAAESRNASSQSNGSLLRLTPLAV